MFLFKELLKKKRSLVNEALDLLYSVWWAHGCSLNKARLLWMNFLKGSTIKASLLSVWVSEWACMCMWLYAQALVCRERTPLMELRGRNRGMPVGSCSWCFSRVVFLLSVIVCSVCIRAFVCVPCRTEVIEAKDKKALSFLSPSAHKKQKRAQMWIRDCLI